MRFSPPNCGVRTFHYFVRMFFQRAVTIRANLQRVHCILFRSGGYALLVCVVLLFSMRCIVFAFFLESCSSAFCTLQAQRPAGSLIWQLAFQSSVAPPFHLFATISRRVQLGQCLTYISGKCHKALRLYCMRMYFVPEATDQWFAVLGGTNNHSAYSSSLEVGAAVDFLISTPAKSWRA